MKATAAVLLFIFSTPSVAQEESDRPVAFYVTDPNATVTVKYPNGETVTASAPGVYLPEEARDAVDAKLKLLESEQARLIAENESLKQSAGDAEKRQAYPYLLALGIGLAAGVGLAFAIR